MNSKAEIVLMNPKAYSVCVFENTFVDEKSNPLPASVTFIANVYAMGKVVDPNGIKIIKAV